jgi:hypothetical protein
LNKFKKKQSLLGWLRLLVVVVSVVLAYRVFMSTGAIVWIIVGIGTIVFLVLATILLKILFAVIATHDVDLIKLETEFSEAIDNYHFDVQVVAGDELYILITIKTRRLHQPERFYPDEEDWY